MTEVMTDIRSGVSRLNSRLHELNEQMNYLEDMSNSLEKIFDAIVASCAVHDKEENRL